MCFIRFVFSDGNKYNKKQKKHISQGIKTMLLDKDIREPLFDFLEETYGKVRVFEEKMMGQSRADAVMVTEDQLIGIEIKSDADTYARLKRQVRDYDRFFDHNIVVVGASHAAHIEEHVPEHWGIITVDETDGVADFYLLREPSINTSLKWEDKIKILWRPELAQLQELNEMPKYKDKSKAFVQEKILARIPDKLSEEELQRQFCNLLFERDYNAIGETISQFRIDNGQKPRTARYRRKASRGRKRGMK